MRTVVDLNRVVDTMFALSALGNFVDDPALPGPIARARGPELLELARRELARECAELGLAVDGDDAVELPGPDHRLLEASLGERVLATITGRPRVQRAHRRLKCRLRPRKSLEDRKNFLE